MVFVRPEEITYRGYELAADLDFAGSRWMRGAVLAVPSIPDAIAEGWVPIGDFDNPYRSTFNGNGHMIMGLCINRSDTDYVGLFGAIGDRLEDVPDAIIRNVGLVDVYVRGNDYVGSLVGFNAGTITSSYATGDVSGDDRVGGLVGGSSGTITSSYAVGTANGDGSVGGLVGRNLNGTITSSCSTGDVSGNGGVGGLVGYNDLGAITSSYATGAGRGENIGVGGLVGRNDRSSIITSSYATGAVMSTGEAVGGLVGLNNISATIASSYATGDVSGYGSVDGLAGGGSGTIRSSYYSSAAVVLRRGAPVPSKGLCAFSGGVGKGSHHR